MFVRLSPTLYGHNSPSRLFSLLERATLNAPPMQLSCSLYYTKISCYFASIYFEILLIPPPRVCWLCALSQRSNRFHGNLLLSCNNFLLKIKGRNGGGKWERWISVLRRPKAKLGVNAPFHIRAQFYSQFPLSFSGFFLPQFILIIVMNIYFNDHLL